MNKKELAILKTNSNEHTYFGNKVVFIDNKSKITNIIFTPINQPHYMMITWFEKYTEYNYLYLNPTKCNYTDIQTLTKTIEVFNSEKYNMIGISYGAFFSIIYSTIFPTLTLIIIDPNRATCNVCKDINLEYYITKINANIFYHRSLAKTDIDEFILIRNALEKTNCFYSIQCTLSDVHAGYILNEDIILSYIKFSEIISQNSYKIIKKDN